MLLIESRFCQEETEMRYLISDIHGCYEGYKKLLDQIHFSGSW